MPIAPHSKRTIARCIQETQPQPFVCIDREVEGRSAICGEVRRAACVGTTVRTQRPGVEDETNIPIDINPFGFINDEQPVERAVLDEARRRVVPIAAGIRRREAVVEAVPRRDCRLGQPGNAVHRIRHAEAVPVDGHVGHQLVDEPHPQLLTSLHPQYRSGDGAFEAADWSRSGGWAPQN